ncbi:hypothetical protein, partial [Thiolapillus sp.]|uniref:hypothetical protein n=1 Tax=Thiolapillus sp. TaxID=2017437 RepID=UPI003AF99F07
VVLIALFLHEGYPKWHVEMSVVLHLNLLNKHNSQHIAHKAAFFFLIFVNQILNTTNTFFMLHNFYLVKVYVHGVTLSQKAVK